MIWAGRGVRVDPGSAGDWPVGCNAFDESELDDIEKSGGGKGLAGGAYPDYFVSVTNMEGYHPTGGGPMCA